MKFGAVLRSSAAELPDTEDLFLKYKQLKKSLKKMLPSQGCRDGGGGGGGDRSSHPSSDDDDDDNDDNDNKSSPTEAAGRPSKRAKRDTTATPRPAVEDEDEAPILLDQELEAEFLRVITADVMELNERYIEKEEDNVIKFGQLEDGAEGACTTEEKVAAYRAFVDFHGELLMLFHWSVLAYTGLVKILKKHRKRTGAPLHAPHLENLLNQPFCSVEVTCDMVRKAEQWVAKLAAELNIAAPAPVPLPEPLVVNNNTNVAAVANNSNNNNNTATTSVGSLPPDEKGRLLEAVAAAVHAVGHQEARREVKEKVIEREEMVGNEATRRIRAALNVWHQLHSNVSTRSTMIADGGGGGGGGGAKLVVSPSNLTNSSVA